MQGFECHTGAGEDRSGLCCGGRIAFHKNSDLESDIKDSRAAGGGEGAEVSSRAQPPLRGQLSLALLWHMEGSGSVPWGQGRPASTPSSSQPEYSRWGPSAAMGV